MTKKTKPKPMTKLDERMELRRKQEIALRALEGHELASLREHISAVRYGLEELRYLFNFAEDNPGGNLEMAEVAKLFKDDVSLILDTASHELFGEDSVDDNLANSVFYVFDEIKREERRKKRQAKKAIAWYGNPEDCPKAAKAKA